MWDWKFTIASFMVNFNIWISIVSLHRNDANIAQYPLRCLIDCSWAMKTIWTKYHLKLILTLVPKSITSEVVLNAIIILTWYQKCLDASRIWNCKPFRAQRSIEVWLRKFVTPTFTRVLRVMTVLIGQSSISCFRDRVRDVVPSVSLFPFRCSGSERNR